MLCSCSCAAAAAAAALGGGSVVVVWRCWCWCWCKYFHCCRLPPYPSLAVLWRAGDLVLIPVCCGGPVVASCSALSVSPSPLSCVAPPPYPGLALLWVLPSSRPGDPATGNLADPCRWPQTAKQDSTTRHVPSPTPHKGNGCGPQRACVCHWFCFLRPGPQLFHVSINHEALPLVSSSRDAFECLTMMGGGSPPPPRPTPPPSSSSNV